MHHLTRSQVAELLRAVTDARHRLAFLLMYHHGLRVTEVCGGVSWRDKTKTYPGLTVEDVAGGYIIVKRLKGSMKTEQSLISSSDPLFDEASQIEDLVTKYQLGPKDKLFPYTREYLWVVLQKAGASTGLPKHLCHPHVLKHSIAMHMVKRIHIDELKQYLGHKSLASTGMYLRVTDAEASRAVMAALEDPLRAPLGSAKGETQ